MVRSATHTVLTGCRSLFRGRLFSLYLNSSHTIPTGIVLALELTKMPYRPYYRWGRTFYSFISTLFFLTGKLLKCYFRKWNLYECNVTTWSKFLNKLKPGHPFLISSPNLFDVLIISLIFILLDTPSLILLLLLKRLWSLNQVLVSDKAHNAIITCFLSSHSEFSGPCPKSTL